MTEVLNCWIVFIWFRESFFIIQLGSFELSVKVFFFLINKPFFTDSKKQTKKVGYDDEIYKIDQSTNKNETEIFGRGEWKRGPIRIKLAVIAVINSHDTCRRKGWTNAAELHRRGTKKSLPNVFLMFGLLTLYLSWEVLVAQLWFHFSWLSSLATC